MVGLAAGKGRRLGLGTRGASSKANSSGATAPEGVLSALSPLSPALLLSLLAITTVALVVVLSRCASCTGRGSQAGGQAGVGPTLETVFTAANTAYKYHMQQREASFARDRIRQEERTRWSEPKLREIFLVPTYPCPFEVRVGEWGEGGKWLCNVLPFRGQMRSSKRITGSSYQGGAGTALNPNRPIVVYSVGSRDETSFEEAIFRLMNVKPYTMDPSLSQAKQEHMKSLPFVHFHNVGLTGKNKKKPNSRWGPLMRFNEVLAMLNHTYVDVLKIDCESCEVDVMQDLLEEFNGSPPIGQVLMEIHHVSIPKIQLELLQIMEQLGFRMFHSENNERYLKAHETAFVHESLADPSLWPFGA